MRTTAKPIDTKKEKKKFVPPPPHPSPACCAARAFSAKPQPPPLCTTATSPFTRTLNFFTSQPSGGSALFDSGETGGS
jgi:hypothetical protein